MKMRQAFQHPGHTLFPSVGIPECHLMRTENRGMEKSCNIEGLFIDILLDADSAHDCNILPQRGAT